MSVSLFENQNIIHIQKIITYNAYWWFFYLLIHFTIHLKLKTQDVLDVKNRMVSMSHGLLSTFFSIYFIFYYGYDMDMVSNTLFHKITYFSLSYFIYDLLACYIFGMFELKLLIHHSLCIAGFSIILFSGKGIFVGVIGLLIAEASNFPMHLRGILKNVGLRHTLLYEISDATFMFTYIFMRAIIGPVVCTQSYFAKSVHILVPMIFVGILVQSAKFMMVMTKIIQKRYSNYLERKSKNISLYWFSINPESKKLHYVLYHKEKTQSF